MAVLFLTLSQKNCFKQKMMKIKIDIAASSGGKGSLLPLVSA